jgi:peptide methionine sulfoxide reductase MsrA
VQGQRSGRGMGDSMGQGSGYQDSMMASGDQQQAIADAHMQASSLTEDQLNKLLPQEVKVVNPWIHDQTHQEYLEKVTVSTRAYELHKNARSRFEFQSSIIVTFNFMKIIRRPD